ISSPEDLNLGLPLDQVRDWLRWQAGVLLGDRLRGKVDVSDMVQDALLKACQHCGQLRGHSEGEKGAWLRRILANTLTDLVRCYLQGRKRNVGREQSLDEALRRSSVRLADSAAGPEDHAQQQERLLWLAAGLGGLPSGAGLYDRLVTVRTAVLRQG